MDILGFYDVIKLHKTAGVTTDTTKPRRRDVRNVRVTVI